MIDTQNNVTFGKENFVKRFMKGMFQIKPSLPRYTYTWDANKVFSYFRSLPNIENLNLKHLLYKLSMVLMLLSGSQKSQTIHCLQRGDITIIDDII